VEAQAVPGLGCRLEIDTLGYLTQQFVSSAFLLFNGFQNHRIIREAQNLGPPAQSSIHCDLVVLDLNMPEEDGLSIIRDLKSRTNVPVIMLTATASPIDRVVGLELGADDYIAKPCELRELMARIRSVLRRSSPARTPAAAPEAAGAKAAKDQLVRFGTKWLDLEAQALRDDEGNEHPLTASEFGLLKVFAANPKRVLSRERLLELANARDSEAFDRAVDLRLRLRDFRRHPFNRLKRSLSTVPDGAKILPQCGQLIGERPHGLARRNQLLLNGVRAQNRRVNLVVSGDAIGVTQTSPDAAPPQ